MQQIVYVFDVDGVLNSPQSYDPDERILDHIATLLDDGAVVALNTGRGYTWIDENVIQPVRAKLNDGTESLQRLFASVEMGGVGVEFLGGVEQKTRSALSLSDEQIEQARRLYDQHPEYADRTYWSPKESMASIDKNNDTPLEEFKPVQKELTDMFRELYSGQSIEISNSTVAVDVHAPEAGKRAGAQLIYEWLQRTTKVRFDRFVCFGDSTVDYEMARFFAEQGQDTTFVFTGQAFDGKQDSEVDFVKTEQLYNGGTYQYLETHKT